MIYAQNDEPIKYLEVWAFYQLIWALHWIGLNINGISTL